MVIKKIFKRFDDENDYFSEVSKNTRGVATIGSGISTTKKVAILPIVKADETDSKNETEHLAGENSEKKNNSEGIIVDNSNSVNLDSILDIINDTSNNNVFSDFDLSKDDIQKDDIPKDVNKLNLNAFKKNNVDDDDDDDDEDDDDKKDEDDDPNYRDKKKEIRDMAKMGLTSEAIGVIDSNSPEMEEIITKLMKQGLSKDRAMQMVKIRNRKNEHTSGMGRD
jgi:hypothetical protein